MICISCSVQVILTYCTTHAKDHKLLYFNYPQISEIGKHNHVEQNSNAFNSWFMLQSHLQESSSKVLGDSDGFVVSSEPTCSEDSEIEDDLDGFIVSKSSNDNGNIM